MTAQVAAAQHAAPPAVAGDRLAITSVTVVDVAEGANPVVGVMKFGQWYEPAGRGSPQ